MKNLLSLFTGILSVAFLTLSISAHAQDVPNGTGSETDPYQISTPGHLIWLSDLVMNDPSSGGDATNGKYFNLVNDIDMADVENFTPIGGWDSDSTNNEYKFFKGTFDGNNFFIRNLTILQPTKNFVGLFGYCVNQSIIQNVGINGLMSGNADAGLLIGSAVSSTVLNCTTSGEIVGTGGNYENIGGLIGNSRFTYTQYCKSSANVSSSGYGANIGGLIGNVERFSIKFCSASGSVSATGVSTDVGALIGMFYLATANNCYATGSVTSSGNYSFTSALVANNYYSKIVNSFSTGSVTSTGVGYSTLAAGVAGFNNNSEITNCYSTSKISGGTSTSSLGIVVGGIAASNNGHINNSYFTGRIIALSNTAIVGGIAGRNDGSISNCYVALIELVSSGYYTGIFCGTNINNNILNSFYSDQLGISGLGGSQTSAGLFAKNPAELKMEAMVDTNATSNTSLNFAQTSPFPWAKDLSPNNINYGYPILLWQMLPDTFFVVTFNTGGTPINNIALAPNSKIIQFHLTPTTLEDHIFAGWYKDSTFQNLWNFETDVVLEDLTLFAKWALNTRTVTFNSNGGSTVNSIEVIFGYICPEPDNPTRIGYLFAGWFRDISLSDIWNFDIDVVVENITLQAKWIINTYAVTFNSQGGSEVAPLTNVPHGSAISQPSTPTRAGYTFSGWFKESSNMNVWNFTSDRITSDTTLYAKWNDVVGIEERETENSVKIYPNPAQNYLKIEIEESEIMAEFYDITGKLLMTKPLINGMNTIDIAQLNKGIYFVKLNEHLKKLIVQ